MSRSRSPEDNRRDDQDRGMSVDEDRKRDRSEAADEAPAKRPRAEAKKEDRARGKRLFGNILGTLQQFKKEDKTARTSEAAKRREQVKERIESKIRSEASLHTDIAETDRELKALRIHTESLEYVLKHKEAAMRARHATLKPTSRFLHTAPPPPAPLVYEATLLNPSPIPLNKGPTREPPQPEVVRPLYFLPKILLPQQQATLDSQIANIDELISDEARDLADEKKRTANTVERNRVRITELASKLDGLRAQRPGKDDFGRAPRGEMSERTVSRGTRDGRREREDREDSEREREAPPDDREAGVQIRGEDGDVEVEY